MSRRTLTMIVFALLAIAEIGDLIGLVLTLASPAEAARVLGITPRAETIRAIILIGLAVLVALNALTALAGMLTRSAFLFQFGALMTGVGLVLYGVYQILSAVFQHGYMQFAGIGLVYTALGALALWFARSAAVAATKA